MSHSIFRLLILFSALFLFACNDIDTKCTELKRGEFFEPPNRCEVDDVIANAEFQLAHYKEHQILSTDKIYSLYQTSIRRCRDCNAEQKKQFANISQTYIAYAFDNKDWQFFLSLYNSSRSVKRPIAKKLIEHYEGEHPFFLAIIAHEYVKQGKYLLAYKAYEEAALSNPNFAKYPYNLSSQFGCTDLSNIWLELKDPDDYEFAYVGFNIKGYDDSKPILTNMELAQHRLALRNNVPPPLPENCPISVG